MISRRAAIQLGVVGGGVGIGGFAAHRAGVLDDGLRAVGVRPHAEPDPLDAALLAKAVAGQTELLAALDALGHSENSSDVAGLRAVLSEQLAAVSDEPPATPTGVPATRDADFTAFAKRVEATAAARADGALSAGSLAVVKVLAAMSAGLEQVAVAARRLA
ncbi:MAG TPA: hypothetical protein VMZ66_10360 [Aeromicrobium sp.]|nr:hypothetical protein [Aeromicrobium sp.]